MTEAGTKSWMASSFVSYEDTLVLSGVVKIGDEKFVEGDYLYTEEGEKHDVVAEEDVLIYVTVEGGIEVIG